MTVMLAADTRLHAPLRRTTDHGADVSDMLDELIAAHRAALLALAPCQEERPQRLEAGWHIAHLGFLLRVRERARCLRDREEDQDRQRPPR